MYKAKDAWITTIGSVAFFLAGIAIGFFLRLSVPQIAFNFSPAIDLLLLSLLVLVFSMLFFGKITPLLFLVIGLMQAGLVEKMPVVMLVQAVPLFLMGFTGTLLGRRLFEDLKGGDNVYSYKRELLKWFAISIIVAAIIGLLNQQLTEANAAVLGFFKSP